MEQQPVDSSYMNQDTRSDQNRLCPNFFSSPVLLQPLWSLSTRLEELSFVNRWRRSWNIMGRKKRQDFFSKRFVLPASSSAPHPLFSPFDYFFFISLLLPFIFSPLHFSIRWLTKHPYNLLICTQHTYIVANYRRPWPRLPYPLSMTPSPTNRQLKVVLFIISADMSYRLYQPFPAYNPTWYNVIPWQPPPPHQCQGSGTFVGKELVFVSYSTLYNLIPLFLCMLNNKPYLSPLHRNPKPMYITSSLLVETNYTSVQIPYSHWRTSFKMIPMDLLG